MQFSLSGSGSVDLCQYTTFGLIDETVQDLKIFRVKIHRGWVSDLVLLNHFSHVLSPLSTEAGTITFSGLEKTHLSFTNCIKVNFHPLRVTV